LQIILVSSRLRPVRTLTLKPWHIVAGIAGLALMIFVSAFVVSWLSLHWRLPMTQRFLHAVGHQDARTVETAFNRNLKALASRVGELQASMMRLDNQSQRLSERTGTPVAAAAPQGGAFVPAPFPEESLRLEIERLSGQIEEKSLILNTMEETVRARLLRRMLLPTTLPVRGGARLGSPFGERIDPFGRGRAMHEGLDFVAPFGTPILAAADGVVVFAAPHPEFGNLVEVNHGGELITRYAHMSALAVSAGTSVRRGQEVGKLGSTGRSTGPHLHFEVRQNGMAIDPAGFLSNPVARNGKSAGKT
jgi:murein DD-endopeptidase MepM/ murein hydrolase activator NlpD